MTVRLRYYTCDVFTGERFGGNQLAVLPQAEGLSGAQMQRIAREFNYSETTFVLPPEAGHSRRVRIFTPMSEVPFAGHPNIGTAFVLAATGALGELEGATTVTFEEDAGLVPVSIELLGGGRIRCELTAPQRLTIGEAASAASVAAAASLSPDDVVSAAHAPLVASVGLPFLVAEQEDDGGTGGDGLKRALAKNTRKRAGAFAVTVHQIDFVVEPVGRECLEVTDELGRRAVESDSGEVLKALLEEAVDFGTFIRVEIGIAAVLIVESQAEAQDFARKTGLLGEGKAEIHEESEVAG